MPCPPKIAKESEEYADPYDILGTGGSPVWGIWYTFAITFVLCIIIKVNKITSIFLLNSEAFKF